MQQQRPLAAFDILRMLRPDYGSLALHELIVLVNILSGSRINRTPSSPPPGDDGHVLAPILLPNFMNSKQAAIIFILLRTI